MLTELGKRIIKSDLKMLVCNVSIKCICRYIYWNSHFYGANFYGWSIGDSRSLFESGPFHSQGSPVFNAAFFLPFPFMSCAADTSFVKCQIGIYQREMRF